jgi:uncharacterized membrane protein YvlD (DUF360 family)
MNIITGLFMVIGGLFLFFITVWFIKKRGKIDNLHKYALLAAILSLISGILFIIRL